MATEPRPSAHFSGEAATGLIRDLQKGKFCDFEFICEGQRMPVHKAIVYSQSSVCATACSGKFIEASSSSYRIQDAKVQTVQLMIQYLYTGHYCHSVNTAVYLQTCGFSNPTTPISSIMSNWSSHPQTLVSLLSVHIDVIALADKYLIGKLVDFACKAFENDMHSFREDAFLAFLDVVPRVYMLENDSAKRLRSSCVTEAKACFGPQVAGGTENRKKLDKALRETPEFCKELLDSFICLEKSIAPKKRKAKNK